MRIPAEKNNEPKDIALCDGFHYISWFHSMDILFATTVVAGMNLHILVLWLNEIITIYIHSNTEFQHNSVFTVFFPFGSFCSLMHACFWQLFRNYFAIILLDLNATQWNVIIEMTFDYMAMDYKHYKFLVSFEAFRSCWKSFSTEISVGM